MTLRRFTCPEKWKIASSQKISLFAKSSFSNSFCIRTQKPNWLILPSWVISCVSCNWYGLKFNLLRKTFYTVFWGVPMSRATTLVDFRGLRTKLSHSPSPLLLPAIAFLFAQTSSFFQLGDTSQNGLVGWCFFSVEISKGTLHRNYWRNPCIL